MTMISTSRTTTQRQRKRKVRYDPKRIRAWLLARGFHPVRLSGEGDLAHNEWCNYQLPHTPGDRDHPLYDYRLQVGVKNYHHPASDIPEPFWLNRELNQEPVRARTVTAFKVAIATVLLVGLDDEAQPL